MLRLGKWQINFVLLEYQEVRLTKAISFFLAAAKDADVNISVHVKAPPPPRSSSGNTTRKQIKRSKDEDSVRNEQRESDLNNDQTERFEIQFQVNQVFKLLFLKILMRTIGACCKV